MNHGGDDDWPRAAQFPCGGKNFYADNVLRGNQAAPCFDNRCFVSEIRESKINHCLHDIFVRLKIGNGVCVLDNDDARRRVRGMEREQIVRAGLKTREDDGGKNKLYQRVS